MKTDRPPIPKLWAFLDKVVIVVGLSSMFLPLICEMAFNLDSNITLIWFVVGFCGSLILRSFLFDWRDAGGF
jgi:hypothetical protein